jgi:hypothetical protein
MIPMSARTYPRGEPMRHRTSGRRATVVWREPDDHPSPPGMVLQDGADMLIVLGEETWEWESMLGPG